MYLYIHAPIHWAALDCTELHTNIGQCNICVKFSAVQCIDQDLSYGEILAGRPGAWLVFYMHAIKKVKKGIYVEIQNDFQNVFEFYDSLYGL